MDTPIVVTGGCERGCASFNVRDSRYPPRPHQLGRFAELMRDRGELAALLRKGADKAQAVASKTLTRTYASIGFLPR